MLVPIANAIFEKNFEIKNILNIRGAKIKNLYFDDVNVKTFPIIKLKNRINEYPSSSIIINASNEILVDQFLHKKLPFLNISKIIMDSSDIRYVNPNERTVYTLGDIIKCKVSHKMTNLEI